MNNGFLAAVTLTAGVIAVSSAGAKTGGWTTADYIQNGLVVQFDGIDNAGTGAHDPDATKWTCLVSGREVALSVGESFAGGNHLGVVGPHILDDVFGTIPSSITLEGMARPTGALPTSGTTYNIVALANSCLIAYDKRCAGGITVASKQGPLNTSAVVRYTGRSCPSSVKGLSSLLSAKRPYSYGVAFRGAAALPDYLIDGQLMDTAIPKNDLDWTSGLVDPVDSIRFGSADLTMDTYAIRVYDRPLLPSEIARNAAIDAVRFRGEDDAVLGGEYVVWTGLAGNGLWSDMGNWTNAFGIARLPVRGERVIFTTSSRTVAEFDLAGLSLDDFSIELPEGVTNFVHVTKAAGGAARTLGPYDGVTGGGVLWLMPGAEDYIQSGLVVQFDAIDNVATGVHSPTATAWTCLKSGARIELAEGESFSSDNVLVVTGHAVSDVFGTAPHSLTVEAVSRPVGEYANENADYAMVYAANAAGIGYDRRSNSGITLRYKKSDPAETGTLYYRSHGLDTAGGVPGLISAGRPYSYSLVCTGTSAEPSYRMGGVAYGECRSMSWSSSANYSDVVSFGSSTRQMRQYAVRVYRRALCEGEVRWNAAVDAVRFLNADPSVLIGELVWTGAAGDGDWGNAANWTNSFGLARAPRPGECCEIPAGVSLRLKSLAVNGQAIPPGAYCGSRANVLAQTVPWLKGEGVVSVLPTASAYVQGGLVLHLDGIDNQATGSHEDSATTWKSLVGDFEVALSDGERFADGNRMCVAASHVVTGAFGAVPSAITLEALSRPTGSYASENANYNVVEATKCCGIGYDTRSKGGLTVASKQNALANAGKARYCGRQHLLGSMNNGSLMIAHLVSLATPFTYAVVCRGETGLPPYYVNGSLRDNNVYFMDWTNDKIGSFEDDIRFGSSARTFDNYAVRVYNRELSPAEIETNALVDAVRYGSADMTALSGGVFWTGAAGNGLWSDAGNWTNALGAAMVPRDGARLVFPAAQDLTSENDIEGLMLAAVSIPGAGASVAGLPFALASGGRIVATASAEIANDIAFGEGCTVWLGDGVDVALTGAQSGTVRIEGAGLFRPLHAKALDLTLEDGAKLAAAAGETLRLKTLTYAGVRHESGTFGSESSSAETRSDAFFAGTGVVQVGPTGLILLVR